MLFVAAMRREADAISKAGEPFVCGAGAVAYDAMAARLAASKPDGVVLFGVCGGLDPSLGAGMLVLSRDVVLDGDGTVLQPDRSLHDGARKLLRREGRAFVSSRLATLPRAVSSKSARRDLWNEHGAGGTDMETYHVARACIEAQVPWIAVRAVLDPFGSRLPRAVRRWRSDADEARIKREALRSPLDWPDYIRLAWELRKATRALAVAAADLKELAPGDIPLDLVAGP